MALLGGAQRNEIRLPTREECRADRMAEGLRVGALREGRRARETPPRGYLDNIAAWEMTPSARKGPVAQLALGKLAHPLAILYLEAVNFDPRDPDLLKWLAVLPLEQQYIYRCALLSIFESFRTNHDFKTDTETIRQRLAPNEKKLAKLWKQADAKAEEIRCYLEIA